MATHLWLYCIGLSDILQFMLVIFLELLRLSLLIPDASASVYLSFGSLGYFLGCSY